MHILLTSFLEFAKRVEAILYINFLIGSHNRWMNSHAPDDETNPDVISNSRTAADIIAIEFDLVSILNSIKNGSFPRQLQRDTSLHKKLIQYVDFSGNGPRYFFMDVWHAVLLYFFDKYFARQSLNKLESRRCLREWTRTFISWTASMQ